MSTELTSEIMKSYGINVGAKCSISLRIGLTLLLFLLAGCNRIPERAPTLELAISSEGSLEQYIQAAQLTTSWTTGSGRGYEADSFHPLTLKPDRYSEITLCLTDKSCEINLLFSDKYPPHSITAQRWNAEYRRSNHDISDEVKSKSEYVELENNTIYVYDDGKNYIYEIYAIWNNGNSRYTFCTEHYQTP